MSQDGRYDRVFSDPKFWSLPTTQKKIKVDKRFDRMFSDPKFCARSAPVDRRGRPSKLVNSKSNESRKSHLEKFYEIEGVESGALDHGTKIPEVESNDDNETVKSISEANKSFSNVRTSSKTSILKKKRRRNHRQYQDKPTTRIAICNQDWDRIRAVDFLMLFRSFLPAEIPDVNKAIRQVTIYQSEYGAKHQAIDDEKGPLEIRKAAKKISEEDDEAMRGALVRYQKSRLKYCYAVVDCDSPDTAAHLYQQLDGLEYEDSCTRLDLSFIPDDVSFDGNNVVSTADSKFLDAFGNYEPPPSFINTALGQTAVKLTWEEEQTPQRKRAFQALLDADSDEEDKDGNNCSGATNLVAPPSDDEEDAYCGEKTDIVDSESDEEERYNRYRSLLLEATANEDVPEKDDAHMEVTWDPGLAGSSRTNIPSTDGNSSGVDQHCSKAKQKRKRRMAEDEFNTDSRDNEVQAFRMMFGGVGEGDTNKTSIAVEGTDDHRFSEFLKRPEFHRDGAISISKKKTKQKAKKSGDSFH